MNMRSMINSKYLVKSMLNSDKNGRSVRMGATFLMAPHPKFRKSQTTAKYKELFLDHTDLKNKEVLFLLRIHARIFDMSTDHIKSSLSLCKNFGVNMRSVKDNITFLDLNQVELRNRLLILREMGAKYINTTIIPSVARDVPVILLRAHAGISEDASIAEIMYSNLQKPPPYTTSISTLSEEITVRKYRQTCLRHYLQWKFKISDAQMNNHMTVRLMYEPLSNIEFCCHVLHKQGKMPLKTIWQYGCLAGCSTNEIHKILEKIPTICGISIVELLRISPSLHKMKYNNVECIKKCLESCNVSGEQLKHFPNVLLVENKEFLESWKVLTKEAKLQVLFKHPNLLDVFRYPDEFPIRIEYMHYLKIPHFTLDVLSTKRSNFERLLKCGAFRKRIEQGCLILSELSKLDPKEIEKALKVHPRWKYSNIFDMSQTLQYLQTKFNNATIFHNLHVILYPKNKVKILMEKLIHNNKLMGPSNRYTDSQLLALCVYEMERGCNFTGDGIWNENHQAESPKLLHEVSDNELESTWECATNCL